MDNCLKFNDKFLFNEGRHLEYRQVTHSITATPNKQAIGYPVTVTVTITNGAKDNDYQVVQGNQVITVHTDSNGNYTGNVSIDSTTVGTNYVDLKLDGVIYATDRFVMVDNKGLPIGYSFSNSVYVQPYTTTTFREAAYGYPLFQPVDDFNGGNIGILLLDTPTNLFDKNYWCVPSSFNRIDCVYEPPVKSQEPGIYVEMTLAGAVLGGAIDARMDGFVFQLYRCTIPSWSRNRVQICGVHYDNTMTKAPILCDADGKIYNYYAH